MFKNIFRRLKYHHISACLAILLSLAGCGQKGVQVGDFSSRGGYCQDEQCTEGPLQAQSVKTIAVVSSAQVLKSWESCLGVNASNTTRNNFERNASTIFPSEGEAKAATGPVMLQAMTLAGDLCTSLSQQEAGREASERRIFNGVNFASSTNPFTREVVEDVVGRISNSCYGRRPVSEDTEMAYKAMLDLSAVTPDGSGKARILASMLCTGLMASTSGLVF